LFLYIYIYIYIYIYYIYIYNIYKDDPRNDSIQNISSFIKIVNSRDPNHEITTRGIEEHLENSYILFLAMDMGWIPSMSVAWCFLDGPMHYIHSKGQSISIYNIRETRH
jgi:hypothetical protein